MAQIARSVGATDNVIVAGLRSSRGASHELLRRLRGGRLEAAITVALLLDYEEGEEDRP